MPTRVRAQSRPLSSGRLPTRTRKHLTDRPSGETTGYQGSYPSTRTSRASRVQFGSTFTQSVR